MNEIEVWTEEGKKLVSVSDCLSVTTKGSDFYAHCENNLSGEINLDSYNQILKNKPEIVDGKALELGKTRLILKLCMEINKSPLYFANARQTKTEEYIYQLLSLA